MNAFKCITVKTAKYLAYVVAGKVTLAKCAKTGRFVNRANAQMIIENMALLAVKAEMKAQMNNGTYMSDCEYRAEFKKTCDFFGVVTDFANGARAMAFNAVGYNPVSGTQNGFLKAVKAWV